MNNNYKEYKELTNKIRQDFNRKIRPYYLEDECLLCGSTEKLHLHHMVPLSEVINQVHKMNITEKEKRTYALGLQIDNTFITVCEECHQKHPVITETHNKYTYKNTYANKTKVSVDCNNLIDDLNHLLNQPLYKKEQDELKHILNIYKYNQRTFGIKSINNYFKDFNIPLELCTGKRKSYRIGESVKKTASHWLLIDKIKKGGV